MAASAKISAITRLFYVKPLVLDSSVWLRFSDWLRFAALIICERRAIQSRETVVLRCIASAIATFRHG